MKVDIVVERYEEPRSRRSQQCQYVTANREQDYGHVELERLRGSFSRSQAIAHNEKCRLLPVLKELPSEEADHSRNPEQQNQGSLPIVKQQGIEFVHHNTAEILAPSYAACAQWSAVVHVVVPL